MTFIGIAIFTVYFHTSGWSIDDACLKQAARCQDAAHAVTNEDGRYEPIYAGTFKTIDECSKAVASVHYHPNDGERVGTSTETLCVPKFDAHASASHELPWPPN